MVLLFQGMIIGKGNESLKIIVYKKKPPKSEPLENSAKENSKHYNKMQFAETR